MLREPRIPLADRKIAFVDVETTGVIYEKHEIIEFAIVDDKGIFSAKVKPTNIASASPEALAVNGYTKQAWANAKPFGHYAQEVAQRLTNVIVVGHNVSFDMEFIERGVRRAGFATHGLTRARVDTLTLALEHLVEKGLKTLSLAACVKFLKIPYNEEEAHGALYDALLAQKVYHELVHNRQLSLFG